MERFYQLLGRLEEITRLEDCVLVGSALLAAHKLRDVNDLDVLVTDMNQLIGLVGSAMDAKAGGADRGWVVAVDPEGKLATITTEVGVIQASTELSAFYANPALTSAQVVAGRKRWASSQTEADYFYTLSLAHWRALKQAAGREKDLDDLALAKDLK